MTTHPTTTGLRRIAPDDIERSVRPPVDAHTLAAAAEIVDAVRDGNAAAVRSFAARFGERTAEQPLLLGPEAMRAALDATAPSERAVLERAAERIDAFARAQRRAIGEVDVPIPGGRAGHTVEPIARAGCYAPGGRHPLPSSALMTAVTARAAGCTDVVVATPGAHPSTLAAAAIAGADLVLAAGGAHAIAALAFGIEGLPPRDVVVGPGNAWVTAAKQLVGGACGIDMQAGPSELLVVADETADPAIVAIDLLAQAEHDTEAMPMLVTTSADLADAVDREIERQLETLATRETAAVALRNGFCCVVPSRAAACAAAEQIGAEHLELLVAAPEEAARAIRHAGAVFLGSASAEVLGDYGAGPNHTLPTGGTARYQAGLSVVHFLRLRTWMRIDDPAAAAEIIDDAAALAEIEGLAAHRASALARRQG